MNVLHSSKPAANNRSLKPIVNGFTLIELLVVIATVAVLSAMLLPALAATHSDSQAFQCMQNHRQLILAWQMYAQDNNDLLAPNDSPYATAYKSSPNQYQFRNWAVGTMEQPLDAANGAELTTTNTVLSTYLTNVAVYHCPADNYIDVFSHKVHPRSYSMNSAVGTLWYTHFNNSSILLGAPVQGGWLPGRAYNANQNTWLTYGKMSSFTRPGPANTFVLIDENPFSINDGALESSAVATAGNTYLIDYPAVNHNGAATISFADGHVIIHKWLDARTYSPQVIIQPGQGSGPAGPQSPDNPDCFYLASITSAAR